MNCTPSVADPSNSTNYKQPTPRKRRSTPLYFPVHARAGGDASGGHPSFVPKVLSVFLARFDGQGLRKRWRLNVVEMLRLRHGSCAAASGRATRFRREKGAAFWYATASRARIRRENTQKPRLGTPPEGLRFDGFTVKFDATFPKAQRDCATNGVAKNHITGKFSDPLKWRAQRRCPQA